MKRKKMDIFIIFVATVLVCSFLFVLLTPAGREWFNGYKSNLQKAEDRSDYTTKKQVEDTCRSMISSYQSDKLVYEQYKDSTIVEEKSWSSQAKMRANKTASEYNNYMLKNQYIWKENVPNDIYMTLAYIE